MFDPWVRLVCLGVLAAWSLSVSAAELGSEDVTLEAYRTCGKLTFDLDSKDLRFANYRVPHGKNFPFVVNTYFGSPYGDRAFQQVLKLFYKPQTPHEPANVDLEVAKNGVMVEVLTLDGPRVPILEKNQFHPEKTHISLKKLTYLQVLEIKKIEASECPEVHER